MKKIIIFFVKQYKKYISPIKGTKCPYYPSCSTYCIKAVEKHGVVKGMMYSSWRIIRCNPLSKGGYDPVP